MNDILTAVAKLIDNELVLLGFTGSLDSWMEAIKLFNERNRQ